MIKDVDFIRNLSNFGLRHIDIKKRNEEARIEKSSFWLTFSGRFLR